jgi:hypothetical protein
MIIRLVFLISIFFSLMVKADIPIVYGVTVCNEYVELERLLKQLTRNIDKNDKIIIQVDNLSSNDKVTKVIEEYKTIISPNQFKVIYFNLDNHFANFKNNLLKNSGTEGYFFQIDADEYLSDSLMKNLKFYLANNLDADLILVPRANYYINDEIVKDEKLSRILHKIYKKIKTNSYGMYRWPSMQPRIINLSNPNLHYIKKVHETITGAQVTKEIPSDIIIDGMYLVHIKTFQKQETQKEYYKNTFNK